MYNNVYSINCYELAYNSEYTIKNLIIKDESDENVNNTLKREVLEFLNSNDWLYDPKDVEEYFKDLIVNGKHNMNFTLTEIPFKDREYEDPRSLYIRIQKLEIR